MSKIKVSHNGATWHHSDRCNKCVLSTHNLNIGFKETRNLTGIKIVIHNKYRHLVGITRQHVVHYSRHYFAKMTYKLDHYRLVANLFK